MNNNNTDTDTDNSTNTITTNIKEYHHLIPFGFAPGMYVGKCSSCAYELFNVDKRARNCVSCATKEYNIFRRGQKELLLTERATSFLHETVRKDKSLINAAYVYIDDMIHVHRDVRRFMEIAIDFDRDLNPVGTQLRDLMLDLDIDIRDTYSNSNTTTVLLSDFIKQIYDRDQEIYGVSISTEYYGGGNMHVAAWEYMGDNEERSSSCGLIHLIAAAIANERMVRKLKK